MKFTKIQGAGNDFIVIDDRAGSFSLAESEIRRLCHRHFGIGADGLILLQNTPIADFRMRIFNSDGKETEGCGNGLRCLGRFLLELGLSLQKTRIAMHEKIVEISAIGEQIGVEMGEPQNLQLHIETEQGTLHFVDTGVPHVVHFVNELETAPLHQLGPFWRRHPLFFPKGTNVNLAKVEKGEIRVRTFERGVEGETLACGTGACAVAIIAHTLYSMPSPIAISFPGGHLEIQIDGRRLTMIGPAVKVFDGIIDFF